MRTAIIEHITWKWPERTSKTSLCTFNEAKPADKKELLIQDNWLQNFPISENVNTLCLHLIRNAINSANSLNYIFFILRKERNKIHWAIENFIFRIPPLESNIFIQYSVALKKLFISQPKEDGIAPKQDEGPRNACKQAIYFDTRSATQLSVYFRISDIRSNIHFDFILLMLNFEEDCGISDLTITV